MTTAISDEMVEAAWRACPTGRFNRHVVRGMLEAAFFWARTPPPSTHVTATLREALIEAKTWHQDMRKACSKQPPSAMRDFAMATHAEQIEQIDAALSSTTEGQP